MRYGLVASHSAKQSLLVGVVAVLLHSTSCTERSSMPRASGSGGTSAATAESGLKKVNLTYADRVAWRDVLKWPQDCEDSFKYADKSFAGLEFFELAANHYLVQVTCYLGAYQGASVFLLLDESHTPSDSKLLTFANYEDSGAPGPDRLKKEEETQLTGTPEFDADTKQLRVINKFRGLGDCGFVATYSFSKQEPALVSLQAKLDCDGKASNPKEWKKIPPP